MAASELRMVGDGSSDDTVLTRLCVALGNRIPLMCVERTLYDGMEQIPSAAIPNGVDQRNYAVYQRFTQLARVNMARPIVDSVSARQRPNGLRLQSGETTGSTEADDEYYRCRMGVKISRAAHHTALHGQAFYLVGEADGTDRVAEVSPWLAEMSRSGDSAVMYSYADGMESVILFRLVRDDAGNVVDAYSHTAVRTADRPSLVSEYDEKAIHQISDKWQQGDASGWNPGEGWSWSSDIQHYPYAAACGALPLVRQSSADMRSQISPHIAAILRIEQGVFDRMCITAMQAFRQRAVKGLKQTVYKDTDPQVVSGQKRAGDPIDFSSIFAMGPAALWLLPSDAEVWESATTDITPLLTAESRDVKELAAASNTPLDILSPDVAGSASGADLKREGIIFKVEQLNALASDAIVTALREAMVLDGDPDAAHMRLQAQWLDPQPRDWTSIGQAVAQLKGVLPVKSIWTMVIGMNEQEVAEAEQNLTDTAFQQALGLQTAALERSLAADAAATLADNPLGMEPNGFPDGEQISHDGSGKQ